jgi:hypothetical protein
MKKVFERGMRAGQPFGCAQGELEAGATRSGEEKGAAVGRGAGAKPKLGTGPGYLAFFGDFLSAFLAFFAMQISLSRSVVRYQGKQSEGIAILPAATRIRAQASGVKKISHRE